MAGIQSSSRHGASDAAAQTTTHHHATRHQPNPTNTRSHPSSPPPDEDTDGQPPTKRRRLVLRNTPKNHTQTTLDHHFLPHQSASTATRPPTKVSVTQPHSQLVETTLNGARHLLDTTDDDLSNLTSGLATPRSFSRLSKRTPQPDIKDNDSKAGDDSNNKRSLRSHDEGPRLKSELAIYFPNYEDIILDAPKEEDFITVDTVLYITDDGPKQSKSQQTSPAGKSVRSVQGSPAAVRNGSLNGAQPQASTPQRSNPNQFNGSPSLNLDMISRTIPDNVEDPLGDDYYLKSHKRAERKEKQLRNIEKERAMHEKVQLDRLLDGLQGHDWLKVLGITGITDGEAKKFEPKRDYFIAEVKALVDKFRLWKEQEKRVRARREAALAREGEEDDEEEDDEEVEDSDAESDASLSPPSSDLNASAARQLQRETASAVSKAKSTQSPSASKGKRPILKPPAIPYVPPPPEVPITSFYAKRHLRDAALSRTRHGRNILAFGLPIPETEEKEFELPKDYVTEGVVRANARDRRRRRRTLMSEANEGADAG